MATYQEQREREYQNKLVKRFQDELGYKYLGNWQYAKGETVWASKTRPSLMKRCETI